VPDWPVSTTSIGRARPKVAGRHGTRVFEHLRDLLAEVDAVSVAVPTVDHHRVARVLLDAGKDVLVEKPMTTTVAEAEDLIRAAAERGAVLQSATSSDSTPRSTSSRPPSPAPRFIEVHGWARSPRAAWISTSSWT
jgi:NAD-dependent oxidoreductase involved in siderophore biosynthesis